MTSVVSNQFTSMKDGTLWITWSKRDSLMDDLPVLHTDRRSVSIPCEDEIPNLQPVTPYHTPQTNRYNSVMSRLTTAKKRATNYSSWEK